MVSRETLPGDFDGGNVHRGRYMVSLETLPCELDGGDFDEGRCMGWAV